MAAVRFCKPSSSFIQRACFHCVLLLLVIVAIWTFSLEMRNRVLVPALNAVSRGPFDNSTISKPSLASMPKGLDTHGSDLVVGTSVITWLLGFTTLLITSCVWTHGKEVNIHTISVYLFFYWRKLEPQIPFLFLRSQSNSSTSHLHCYTYLHLRPPRQVLSHQTRVSNSARTWTLWFHGQGPEHYLWPRNLVLWDHLVHQNPQHLWIRGHLQASIPSQVLADPSGRPLLSLCRYQLVGCVLWTSTSQAGRRIWEKGSWYKLLDVISRGIKTSVHKWAILFSLISFYERICILYTNLSIR